ncbi:MAG TPA: sigma-54 dependent transcriptional regulator [Polyangiaceae bacterium]|jgi:DNA-binding NtrC family response regulator
MTLRVLLVDDEEQYLRGLSRELRQLGWEVHTATDGAAALRAVSEREFEALVIDFQMPGQDGVRLLGEVAKRQNRPVTVLLSGYLNVQTTMRAVHQGATDVLEKPIAGGALDARLRTLLESRTAAASPSSGSSPANAELAKILGDTPSIRAVRDQVQTVARYPELSVTVVGETGTGKGLVAEAIHSLGSTAGRYIPLNVGAVPEQFLEAELFGRDSADENERRIGLFELAGPGTLFISELAELPQALHNKLLRVLESRKFRRVNGQVDLPFRARMVAATRRRVSSHDLKAELFYRLSAFTILLPALRDRVSDIEGIASGILNDIAQRDGRQQLTLEASALAALKAHHWPGNVRELEIVLSEAAALTSGQTLSGEDIRSALREHGLPNEYEAASEATSGTFPTSMPVSEPLRSLERRMITDAWETSGKNLSAAARTLGLPRTTLRDRLKKYGLR